MYNWDLPTFVLQPRLVSSRRTGTACGIDSRGVSARRRVCTEVDQSRTKIFSREIAERGIKVARELPRPSP